MLIQEIVLKITSSCNLNCSYCYVFNKGDFSFKDEPVIFDLEIADFLLCKIDDYCLKNNLESFLIIFHGGEPLTISPDFYVKFIEKARRLVTHTDLQFSLQTNGTLLNDAWCKLFRKLDIQVGVSLDGPERANKHRVYKSSGNSAFQEIIKGFKILQNHQQFSSILSVVNVNEDPLAIYDFFKKMNIYSLDLLFPEATYEKSEKAINKIGLWLIKVFDVWYKDTDSNRPIIRSFDILLCILLGEKGIGNESFGTKPNTTISIKSNGNIEPVDSLKVCGNGFTKTNFNIRNHWVEDFKDHKLFKKYYNAHRDVLCQQCQDCIIKNICGGGQLAHRYSKINEFDNPSVYCQDIRELVVHIQNELYNDVASINGIDLDILTMDDFK